MPAHFPQTGKNRPVLVNHDQFLCHQTTCRVFVVVQQIYDIPGLFQVFHMRKHFVLLFIRHAGNQVRRVIRIHVVDESAGNDFGREGFNKMYPFFFVYFCQNITGFFVVEKQENELCPLIVQFFQYLCNICGMEVCKLLCNLCFITCIYQLFQLT